MPHNRQSLRLTDAYRRQLAIYAGMVEALARARWNLAPDDPQHGFDQWLGSVLPTAQHVQVSAARTSAGYLSAFLSSELGRRAVVNTPPSAGYAKAPNGESLRDLLIGAIIAVNVAKQDKPFHEASREGLNKALRNLVLSVWTAARNSLHDGMADKRFIGWRRALNPPHPCGACLGLATERILPADEKLKVHPFCECTAEPVVRNVPDRFPRPSGQAMFRGMSARDQNQALGDDAAQRVRGGLPLAALVETSPLVTQDDFVTQKGP